MGERELYLDYAAATPLDERVFLAMEPYLKERFYNPSASYQAARRVRADYEDARHRLAMAIGARQHEIVITAGATESINLALHGVLAQYGGRVATARIEHAAVVESARAHQCDWIAVDQHGFVTADAARAAITPETTLLSVGYINNELGTVQPLRDIATVVMAERERRLAEGDTRPIFLHTDASQAAGLLDISVSRLGVDLMTLNSSKCYGPKQVGLLWARAGIVIAPLTHGGGQENSLRPGTENVAGTIGFATALELAVQERKDESYRLSVLRDQLQKMITDALPEAVVNGHPKRRAPHILHISFPGLDGERVVYALDERGVMAATGSACAANSGTRSHVLGAVGMSDELADGSLRLSLGRLTTEQDVSIAAAAVVTVVTEERGR